MAMLGKGVVDPKMTDEKINDEIKNRQPARESGTSLGDEG
jgi:hypothetical protein